MREVITDDSRGAEGNCCLTATLWCHIGSLGVIVVTRSQIVALSVQKLCTFYPGQTEWCESKQDPSAFAASSLAEVLFRGQGVKLNMTQGLGPMCALQLLSCLKQNSPIKAVGVQPAPRNCPPE